MKKEKRIHKTLITESQKQKPKTKKGEREGVVDLPFK